MSANDRDIGLGRYLHAIRSYPLLTADEEYRLAKEWRDQGNLAASHRLVTSHLRLVASIALRYRDYGPPVSELISEGSVGMLEAVIRFDPDRGTRLATYAMWWVRSSIQDYVMHTSSLVKIGTTRAQKKLFFNLRNLKARRGLLDDRDLPPDFVAEISVLLGVSEGEVVAMNRRLGGPDHSLNVRNIDDDGPEWQDQLIDGEENPERHLAEREELALRKGVLDEAFRSLSQRERQIVTARRLDERPPTLRDLTHQFSVSTGRVRQIESNALRKLRRAAARADLPRRAEGRTVEA